MLNQLDVRVQLPETVDDNAKAWAEAHLAPDDSSSTSPAADDSVVSSLLERGELVLLTRSQALLRMPASLLPAAYQIGQEKTVVQAEDPAVVHVKQMEAQVERSQKAVEDRQKDFEKENTKRYDVDPDDEVQLQL